MVRRISILGVTGSIGQSTLKILREVEKPEDLQIVALSADTNIELLARNAIEFNAEYAVVSNVSKFNELKSLLSGSATKALAGTQELIELAKLRVDWTMSAIVGAAGLAPSLAVAEAGGILALANKESLVCGGDLLNSTIEKSKAKLIPVDSEHSAIYQCLRGQNKGQIEKIILTASGGPFRTWTKRQMKLASIEQSLSHPNWQMGRRISIDSATMFNKALELIEAKYLFDISPNKLEVMVHPQSIVHSMVSFVDGAALAQLGVPDMCGAIGYAFNYPDRLKLPVSQLDLLKVGTLEFEKPNYENFPALKMSFEIMKSGGNWGTVFNAAKETAVDKFLNGEINLVQISDLVQEVLESQEISCVENMPKENIDDILKVDSLVRNVTRSKKV